MKVCDVREILRGCSSDSEVEIELPDGSRTPITSFYRMQYDGQYTEKTKLVFEVMTKERTWRI